MTEINEVIIQGVIVHKFITPKVGILTISTGKARSTTNYPKVIFFGDTRKEVEEKFKEGDCVHIVGNIQSSKPKSDVKNQSMIAVFGESVELAQSTMEKTFGVKADNSRKEYINTFKIAGTVTRIECPVDNMLKLVVFTKKNNRPSFVTLVYFTKKTSEILSKIHPKDKICAVGSVQTDKKEIKGETRYFENYVISEIAKD